MSVSPPGHSRPSIYVVDTNILYALFKGQHGFGAGKAVEERRDKTLQEKVIRLFETSEVVIPRFAFHEIIYQIFHVNIDLENYDQWHKMRISLFKQSLYSYIFSDRPGIRVSLAKKFDDEIGFNVALAKISASLFLKLKNRIKRQQERYPDFLNTNKREPKCLDGMDAALVGEFLSIALANPGRQHGLISNDELVRLVVGDLKSAPEKKIGGFTIPENIFVTNF
ncbi:MAG: hypothetical protein HQM09_22135 [Candidatus Riflebacteria bacterium]|nr:hypothetical protein [Candidatus Riflebacteria bacterium]